MQGIDLPSYLQTNYCMPCAALMPSMRNSVRCCLKQLASNHHHIHQALHDDIIMMTFRWIQSWATLVTAASSYPSVKSRLILDFIDYPDKVGLQWQSQDNGLSGSGMVKHHSNSLTTSKVHHNADDTCNARHIVMPNNCHAAKLMRCMDC